MLTCFFDCRIQTSHACLHAGGSTHSYNSSIDIIVLILNDDPQCKKIAGTAEQ